VKFYNHVMPFQTTETRMFLVSCLW